MVEINEKEFSEIFENFIEVCIIIIKKEGSIEDGCYFKWLWDF